MDTLETLIRDTLREHAVDAPRASMLVKRQRFPTLAVALSAAAAVAVAIVLVLLVRPGSGGPGTPAAIPAHPATGAAPAGYAWASYHGIEIAVPKIIRWIYVTCYPPTTGYVEFTVPNVATSCPPRPVGQSDAPGPGAVTVTLAPVGTQLDGQIAGDHRPWQQRTVPDPGVVVQVGAPTQAQVDLILGSIRRTPVDHLGCGDRLVSTTPTNPPASSLVENGPRSAVVCSYTPMQPGNRYWLVSSHALDASGAAVLATRFASLPTARPSTIGSYLPPVDWVVFDYGSTTRTVAIERDVDPAYVTDGHRTLVANSAAGPPLPEI